ncbi:hypothetical protein ABPG77_004766 [Micractinium sp. CCAP 211/92]
MKLQQCQAAVQQHRRRAAARPSRSSRLRLAAIGFDLPGAESNNKSAEKHAEELTRGAASLLLYSGVLKGKPAQAFLGVLQLLQKGNPLLLVQQYGELYRLLAADDYASWQDYLLDQARGLVIKGSDSPLARAAAAGKPTRHLRAAAAADLDTLQQLAVTEKTLAGWVKDMVYGLPDQWLEAASSLTPPQGSQPVPEAVHEALLAAEAPPPALLAPLSDAQRAGLRAELAGKWRWSEGIELLERHHAAHGFGLVSQHRVLTWTGKLQAQDVLKGVHELGCAERGGLVGSHHPAAAAVHQGLVEFLRQDLGRACSPPHIALCGSAADRWLFASWALQYLRRELTSHAPELREAAGGLRTLVLPAAQLGSLPDLAWSLSQHPRARFVVLANGMGGDGGSGGAVGGDVAAMLSGFDGFSWPPNALLLAGFPSAVPEQLAPVFRHTATIEDRFAA